MSSVVTFDKARLENVTNLKTLTMPTAKHCLN